MTLREGLAKPSVMESSLDPIIQLEDTLRHFHAEQLKQLENVDLFQRLAFVCHCTRSSFGSGSTCMFQPWLSYAAHQIGGEGVQDQLFATPMLGLDGSGAFKEFRAKSCLSPLSHRNSMPGRVWRTGALQVVQSLRIIPQALHPRLNLSDADLDKVAETLYIPVYDILNPKKGTVSVLEVFLSAKAEEPMLVADFISFITTSLAAVNLSLSDPQPQPIHRSTLCGRRARPAAASEDDVSAAEKGTSPDEGRAQVVSTGKKNEEACQKRLCAEAHPRPDPAAVKLCKMGSTGGVGPDPASQAVPRQGVTEGVQEHEDQGNERKKVRRASPSTLMRSKSMHSVHAQIES